MCTRTHEEGNLVNAPPLGRDTPVIIGVGEIITRVLTYIYIYIHKLVVL